ncbi:MAG: SDR family NAD(P)-dependent oxidoreductase [Candidatus Babeliales bacterium]
MKLYKSSILFISLTFKAFCFFNGSKDYRDLFENKKILITGGTGFIGKALISEIIKYNPDKIVIFSRDEVKHAKLLEDFNNNEKIVSILGDIRNYESIWLASKNIDLVIHAAALKRIDILEYNIFESIYTNLIGTMNIAKACIDNKVKTALLISTDKACSPVNTYGACKFISEKIFTNTSFPNETRFLVVRYGNVLQSTGSVIPFFCEKIKNKQAVLLTSCEMTRFFITKKQAVEHIFKTLKYGCGGEIFVPQIPSFKIIDLIYVLQKKLGQETEIQIIGIRPGEKIHEVMINNLEVPRTYKFNGMYVILSTIKQHLEETAYTKYGQLLNITNFNKYSSRDSIISFEDFYFFLEKNNILSEKMLNKKKNLRMSDFLI